jgi:hypothetical protein
VVVEPRRAIHRHEFGVLVGEAFDFERGVVDAGGEEGGVEIADGGEVAVVARAAREGDGFMGGPWRARCRARTGRCAV